jgi:hypothetical protein
MITQTYTDFSWTIWHEGVRIYDDGFPGQYRNIDTIRAEAVGRQHANQGATDRINAASNNELTSYLPLINGEVFNNFLLGQHFQWVAYHEGLLQNFRTWLAQHNFGNIRASYAGREQHNPNAHNLLSAVSDQQIANLINAL